MASEALTRLLPVLKAIASVDVQGPDEVPNEFAAYGYQLAARLGEGALGTNFVSLRLPADAPAAIRDASAALLDAQALWTDRRSTRPAGELAKLTAEAEVAYQRIRTAVNLICGDDSETRATLRLSGAKDADKRGAAFSQLAAIIESNHAKFLPTDPFEPVALAAEARSWSSRLHEAYAAGESNAAALDAKDTRDRAYTHLDSLIDRVRAAAAFVFAGDAKRLRAFMSRD